MIHTLPGNRLEHLVDPLATLLAMPVDNPLEPDRILVQHPGMAHWLNMRLAEHPQRRVAMNLEYPLPVTQMWSLIRAILGSDRVPERSAYQREVLAWRIFEQLGAPGVADDPVFAEPNRYWQAQSERQQPLRRFQLAEELADLYEQYQMYRPDWILAWDDGQGSDWQAQLWRRLVAAEPGHPLQLLEEARQRLAQPAEALPQRLFVFGINTLAPLWLEFMRAVSDHSGVDFHILYLNPSDEYWGDLVSEKQQARQRARWLAEHEGEDADLLPLEAGNPLLSGLGQQGQQFVRLLSEVADLETPLFTEPGDETLLAQLQRDVLHLRDGREAPAPHDDGSIEIVSAHSPLREVQALHDWLLHRFNEDPDLKPRDVVVMCPNVERYAPFVEAVFAGREEDLEENAPPLPCSIADRNPGLAEPATAAFLELLSLPDARFQVSQIIGWLQVPAIRARFGLDDEQVQRLTEWLQVAHVHWGLDADHKAQWVDGSASDRYSWGEGLERLLLGFAWGDEEVILGDRLLVPHIEGEDALILGRLIAFLRTLKAVRQEMRQSRTVPDWQAFLHERLRSAVFHSGGEHEAVQEDLREVIRELGEHAGRAGFKEAVPLSVIRHRVEGSLQVPARTGRQFLTGQVTVCSMVPMRSIPFRVIAVLGLNDGDFPRQRPPLGFDRMADDRPRPGDRSRRGDDRYLFLEALLSARDWLYLSYQGRDVRSNAERQPSLVLGELIAYLERATGWTRSRIRQLALQPFSADNYRREPGSFDSGWLRLARRVEPPQRRSDLPEPDLPEAVEVDTLLRDLAHPAATFARNRLSLYLEDRGAPELQDAEPFATDHLMRHRVETAVAACCLRGEPVEPVLRRARLSGELPEHAMIDEELVSWRTEAEAFAAQLAEHGVDAAVLVDQAVAIDAVTVTGRLPVRSDGTLVHWRLANPKGKDYLQLWLYHLLANAVAPRGSLGLYRGGDRELAEVRLPAFDREAARLALSGLLDRWRQALVRPLPFHVDLLGALAGVADRSDRESVQKALKRAWEGNPYSGQSGVGDDPYIQWFWGRGEGRTLEELADGIEAFYGDLLDALAAGAGDASEGG